MSETHEHYAREIYVNAEDEAGSMGYLPEVLGGMQDARVRDVEDLWKEVTELRKVVADLQAEMRQHVHYPAGGYRRSLTADAEQA